VTCPQDSRPLQLDFPLDLRSVLLHPPVPPPAPQEHRTHPVDNRPLLGNRPILRSRVEHPPARLLLSLSLVTAIRRLLVHHLCRLLHHRRLRLCGTVNISIP